ncbi:hypothetical protein LSAT2_002958 [Lamellibrachia satsuma]|nr:hypothetical protein LSAT2_002958 [Lamellibrachia satsuma]
MATQHFVDEQSSSQQMMNLKRLQSEEDNENAVVISTGSAVPDEATMNASTEKVQEWLDTYEDDIILTSSSSTSSTAPTDCRR